MTGRLTSTKQSRRVDRVSFQGDRILANLSAEGQLVRHLQIRGDKGTAKNKLHGPPQFRGVFDQVNCPKSDIFSDNFMQGNLNLSLQINCSPEHIFPSDEFLRSLEVVVADAAGLDLIQRNEVCSVFEPSILEQLCGSR